METNLKEEIDALEERNLSLMTEMYKGRKADLQAMCRIQQVAVDHSNVLDRRGSGSLPSLRSSTSRLQLATSETSVRQACNCIDLHVLQTSIALYGT